MGLTLVLIAVGGLCAVLLTYPGEWSQLGARANKWLYDHSARNYQRKWQSEPYLDPVYTRRIRQHASAGLAAAGLNRVLDLGCGTGRGTRLLVDCLPADTQFCAIDNSPRMLEQFRLWLDTECRALAPRVTLGERELGQWASQPGDKRYGAVLLLEVGEFVPRFAELVRRIGLVTAAGGSLVLTRPAGYWYLCFPGRHQSRAALTSLLLASGFEQPQFLPWRARYELVFAHKRSG